MPKPRPPYPAEYREQILELARAGRTPEELQRLRRENKQLTEEREILKKDATWFAREIDEPKRKNSSGSSK